MLGLVVVDHAQKHPTAQGHQPALGDCLHRHLPRFFCYQRQLPEIIALFVVLVKRILFAVFCCQQSLNHDEKFGAHISLVDDVLIGLEGIFVEQIA